MEAGVSNDCQQVVKVGLIFDPSDHVSSPIVYANYDETIERFEQVRPYLPDDHYLE